MDNPHDFIVPHSQRNAAREAEAFITEIIEVLVKHGVSGKTVNPFGEKGFDITHPSDLFDHLEFKVICTGWGRIMKNQSSEENPNDQ